MTDEELKQLAVKELLAYVKGEASAMCPTIQNYWKEHIEKTLSSIDKLEAALTEQKQYTAFKCAQSKEKIEALEKEKCELLGIIQGKDKAIADLQNENAQLKEQNANLIAMLKSEREVRVNDDYLRGVCELESKVEDWASEYYELENFMNNKFSEAKKIIKELLDFDFLPENEIKKQAEQFLSGAKK